MTVCHMKGVAQIEKGMPPHTNPTYVIKSICYFLLLSLNYQIWAQKENAQMFFSVQQSHAAQHHLVFGWGKVFFIIIITSASQLSSESFPTAAGKYFFSEIKLW